MKPRHLLHLHNLAAALADITDRYELALRRLDEAVPVYASKVPGNGDPPGGHGSSGRTSSTERLATRAAAGRLPELVDLEQLRAFPTELGRRVHELLDAVGHVAAGVSLPSYGRDPTARFGWARWAVGQLIAGAPVVELDSAGAEALARLRKLIEARHAVISYWGAPVRQPTLPKLALDSLADDPTENWCRSCLRVGVRSPRWRGDLCKWCYEFHLVERMLPPADIIVARSEGKRITEAMVRPHRPAKKGKRKARRR